MRSKTPDIAVSLIDNEKNSEIAKNIYEKIKYSNHILRHEHRACCPKRCPIHAFYVQ